MDKDNPAETEETAASLRTLKQEVDALQIAFEKQDRPWYRDVSTIIAVLALVFSFGTTWVSSRKADAQDVENQRIELRGLLQRLAMLPKENLDAMQKYRADPGALGTVAGYINQENAFLSAQAAEIARRLPPGKISAVEYYAIALALGNSYNLDGEKKFLSLCIQNASDFNTEIAAVRTNAILLFLTGHPDAGRVEYQKALAIFDKNEYAGYDEFTKISTHVRTQLSWAYSEYSIRGGRATAEGHIKGADGLVETLQPGPGREQLLAEIQQTKQQVMASEPGLPISMGGH
jgi:hypothetical protein